jgi:hypothetical protein
MRIGLSHNDCERFTDYIHTAAEYTCSDHFDGDNRGR